MQDSSNPAAAADEVAAAFRDGAADLGEVMAYLAGGIHPDPDTVSRLLLLLHVLRNFLTSVADRNTRSTAPSDAHKTREVA